MGLPRARCEPVVPATSQPVLRNVTSRVKPRSAAAASKSRPIEVVLKVRTSFSDQFQSAVGSAAGKPNGRGGQIRQAVDLRQKSGRRLHRDLAAASPPAKRRLTQVGNPVKSFAQASHKDFATPDAAIVAVSGAVEADSDNALRPIRPARQEQKQHARGDAAPRASAAARARSVSGRSILRMKSRAHHKIIPIEPRTSRSDRE